MAISVYPATTSCLQSRSRALQPSFSFGSKVYEGLRVQIPNTWDAQKSNLNAQIFNKVYKSMNSSMKVKGWLDFFYRPITSASGTSGCKKRIRNVVTMMTLGGTPVVMDDYPEGREHLIDLWNYFFRQGVIFLGEWIDENYSNQILTIMLYLDTIEDFNRLYLLNNCPGGDVTPGLTIYDTMKNLQTPMATYNLIHAVNLVALIVAGGEKGCRLSSGNAFYTISSPAGTAYGQADDIQAEAEELRRIRDYIYQEFAQITGQPIDKIHEDLRKGTTFTAQEAADYGLIDRVLKHMRFPPRKNTTKKTKKR